MASTLRNALQARSHRERAQPSSRTRLGLLEKHKDYVLRAKDYNLKQKRLHALKQKAYFRNPDEFYYKMVSTKTRGGVHIAERNEKFDHEFLTLLKTQDQNYVNYQRMINLRKMEKLRNDIHIPSPNAADHLPPIPNEPNEMEADDDDEFEGSNEPSGGPRPKKIIFVDDDQEAESIVHALSTIQPAPPKKPSAIALELAAREKREQQLRKAKLEMQIQKDLMNNKGARKKVGVDKSGLAVFKWRAERKK
ncbi:hypothetical protein SeMB42_g05445 [Synchytrium endobioticum]|uniref:U3 small nucleolar RNA-associated protein 11 n=1 Tax=Synchytrium endobioticum TaxID=286115 RepID=A0A507CL44_9FUNG|nr:hypothetical protein SeLEV6574_g07677 [Synchytrium endobioticum]TPX41739.1 hypothetical protein SeMB42_g05445 [Synchytrium endobioticum]